jgi:hypothetical protein
VATSPDPDARTVDAAAVVAQAIAAGKIDASHTLQWLDAYRDNPAATRAALAAVMPSPSAGPSRTVDDDLAYTYARITGSPVPAPARTPAAQAKGHTATYRRPISAAAATAAGIDVADEALYNEVAWGMRGRSSGVKPPQRQDESFYDPNRLYVAMNADGTGHWVDPGQHERERSMRAQTLQEQARAAEQKERDAESLREFLAGR